MIENDTLAELVSQIPIRAFPKDITLEDLTKFLKNSVSTFLSKPRNLIYEGSVVGKVSKVWLDSGNVKISWGILTTELGKIVYDRMVTRHLPHTILPTLVRVLEKQDWELLDIKKYSLLAFELTFR